MDAETLRSEQEIFDELATMCASPGFAHVIAYFYLRDHVIGYGDELRAEDYADRRPAMERLIRTELSTLVGLMLRAARNLDLPSPDDMQSLVGRTEALLTELHRALDSPIRVAMEAALKNSAGAAQANPFANADAMREPIFYGAESAYSSQYCDLAVRKYARDKDWLERHKEFSAEEGKQVVTAINAFLNEKLRATLKGLKGKPPEQWTVLSGFAFSAKDIASTQACQSKL